VQDQGGIDELVVGHGGQVLGRLIELDADTYEPWGFQDLKAGPEREGITVRTFDGRSVVRADDVERALRERGRGAEEGGRQRRCAARRDPPSQQLDLPVSMFL
jgi:hypothetical protein